MTTDYQRRKFISTSCKTTLSVFTALNFGCSINSKLNHSGKSKAVLIYGTRYGSTMDTAAWINRGADSSLALANIESVDFSEIISSYDQFVLGSGVWTGGVHRRLKEFLTVNSQQLQGNKVIASFIVCGSQNNTETGRISIKKYLAQIHKPIAYTPKLVGQFGGRIVVNKLSPEDKQALTRFYRKYLNRELQDWDRTDESKASALGKKLHSVVAM